MPFIDISRPPTAEQLADVSGWLAKADCRVIRPLEQRESFAVDPRPAKLITVAILDVETTGTNPTTDKIIELGIVLVEIDPDTGQAYRVLKTFDQLEDPGFPIPPEMTKIHNITDEMVAGRRIDDVEVEQLMSSVALVIAHNAGFDRPFVEKRFPVFSGKAWACSYQQVPWNEEGIGTAKLEYLAYRFGFHYMGHRASTDCHALLTVLQGVFPLSGQKVMYSLLVNMGKADVRVSALDSPFESKDLLRERGYRWNGVEKVWVRELPEQRLEEETVWLKSFIYKGQPFQLRLEKLTAMNRFSIRQGELKISHY